MMHRMRRLLAPRDGMLFAIGLAFASCDGDPSARSSSESAPSLATAADAMSEEAASQVAATTDHSTSPSDYDLSNLEVGNSIDFRQKLRMTLAVSNMPPAMMVQHVMNRLAYGSHPESFRAGSRLLKFHADGSVDHAASKDAIANFIAGSLNQRAKATAVSRAKLEKEYPLAKLTYPQIMRRANALRAAVQAASTPEAETQARQAFTSYLQQLRRTAEAEQLINAVLDDSPLLWTLIDFWFNHLNVSAEKVPADVRAYRDALVPRLFSTYNELLLTSATHPAMLIYLDNAQNRVVKPKYGNVIYKINENYAREILELHTFGRGPRTASYPSPYEQADVEATALLLTGWGIITDDTSRRFFFDPAKHAPGSKRIMGRTYVEGRRGVVDFIQFIANHPSTGRNLARKLIHHYVREDLQSSAAQSLQARLEGIFQATSGSLLSMYEELFSSPEFWDEAAFRSKIKRPLAFVVSTLRASGHDQVSLSKSVIEASLNQTAGMGQRLLWCSPPTGYSDDSAHWATSSNVIAAVRFAFATAGYHGRNPQRYANFEATARRFATIPDAMALYALQGLTSVYDLSPMTSRFGLSSADLDIAGGLAAAAKTPDRLRSSNTPMPVRSALGALLGSAEFLKN